MKLLQVGVSAVVEPGEGIPELSFRRPCYVSEQRENDPRFIAENEKGSETFITFPTQREPASRLQEGQKLKYRLHKWRFP
jgi:uncharacterized protein YecE (DUF72 family)